MCIPVWRIWLQECLSGVPVKLGRSGIEEIIEIKLDKDEKKMLTESAQAVQELMKVVDDMNLFS
jgi:malate dehydrogenase